MCNFGWMDGHATEHSLRHERNPKMTSITHSCGCSVVGYVYVLQPASEKIMDSVWESHNSVGWSPRISPCQAKTKLGLSSVRRQRRTLTRTAHKACVNTKINTILPETICSVFSSQWRQENSFVKHVYSSGHALRELQRIFVKYQTRYKLTYSRS
jgi:hypothetical protein